MKEEKEWWTPLTRLRKNHLGGMKEFASPPPAAACMHSIVVIILTDKDLDEVESQKVYKKLKSDPEKLLSSLMKVKPGDVTVEKVKRIEKRLE